MTSRQIRRAEERHARKLARNTPGPAVVAPAQDLIPNTDNIHEPPAPHSRTRAEINRENAQHSTGPRSHDGKAASSKNRLKHGFRGEFTVLASECQDAFDALLNDLRLEHQPTTPTENILVEALAQHYWLSQRAELMQGMAMRENDCPRHERERLFALYLRYQSTNDRAFSRCLHDLLKLKAVKQKEQQAAAAEARKGEIHQIRVRTVNAAAKPRKPEAQLSPDHANPSAQPNKEALPFTAAHSAPHNARTEP